MVLLFHVYASCVTVVCVINGLAVLSFCTGCCQRGWGRAVRNRVNLRAVCFRGQQCSAPPGQPQCLCSPPGLGPCRTDPAPSPTVRPNSSPGEILMTSPCLPGARGPMGQPRPLSRGLPSSEGRVVAWCLKTGDGEAGGKGWGQVGPYQAQVCTLTLKAKESWFVFWGFHSLPGRHRSQTTGLGKGMKEARPPRHLLA